METIEREVPKADEAEDKIHPENASAGMRIRDLDRERIKEEISDAAKRILGKPGLANRKRKTDITMTEQGFVCMRIEKFHPEEKLTIGKDNKVEFTTMGKEYAGNKIMTATFNDEVILLLSVGA